MAAQDAFNPGQEAASVTASPNISTVQSRYDPNAGVNSLIQALGADSTQRSLDSFNQAYQQKKLQDQSLKIDAYTQQFMGDHQGGAVSQAQLKERFPEMVPVIAARVAESIGKKQGALDIAKSIEEINGNDSLRLDTAQRAAFVAKRRSELFAQIPQGNDFYAAGVVSAMDRAFGQEELKWQGQTATYHQEVQKTALSDETVGALNSPDPKAALAAIDANYGKSSSLNNLERNKVYVDSVIKTAAISDDPNVLDKIPQQYLNADSKAQIYQARIAITNQQWAKFTRAKEFEAYQRTETERTGKLDILKKLGSGQDVDPAQYLSSPGLHEFAVQAMSTPSVPEASSKAAVQAFRTSLLSSSNVMTLGSQQDLTTAVFGIKGINPKERAALVDEIPKLMEGTVLMNDPNIRRAYADNLSARMDDLSKSPSAQIQRLMGTGNLRGNAMAMFEGEIRGNFEAAYNDPSGNKQWPTGFAARKIVDAAVAKTSAYVDRMTSVEGLRINSPDAPTESPKGTPSGRATPTPKATPTGLPKGVTLIK